MGAACDALPSKSRRSLGDGRTTSDSPYAGPTASTNGNINPFVLTGGYHVIWTGVRGLKHDGSHTTG